MQRLRQLRGKAFPFPFFNPTSLQFRLALEIAVLWILGLSSVAFWSGWKMQQMLIANHTERVEYAADRFPQDVELYSEMLPIQAGLQRTIDNVAISGLLIWVDDPNGRTLARSTGVTSNVVTMLLSLVGMPSQPQVHRVGDLYFVLCERPVVLKGTQLGTVYLAQNVTEAYHQLTAALRALAAICVLTILLMTALVTLRTRQLLQPLQEISQMAKLISSSDLGKARMRLTNAPSEVKELTQTLDMLLIRLSKSWEQQRQFVSNVSHELRTPLTLVSGYLQSVLRRSSHLNEYQREALEIAASEADRTIRLLEDLLELARADSGHLHLDVEPIMLNTVVVEVADMTEKFSHRRILVEAPTDVIALADRDRLKQVLLNLLDNAMKYSDPDQPIGLKVVHGNSCSLIQISDRGIGIPLPEQIRIFERFYRVDETRSRTTGGYGLGLAVVKTLVKEMGGSIAVESKLGEGSTFTISLRGVNTAKV